MKTIVYTETGAILYLYEDGSAVLDLKDVSPFDMRRSAKWALTLSQRHWNKKNNRRRIHNIIDVVAGVLLFMLLFLLVWGVFVLF